MSAIGQDIVANKKPESAQKLIGFPKAAVPAASLKASDMVGWA